MRVVIAILAVWVAGMLGYLAYEQFWTGGKGGIVVLTDPPGAEIYIDLRPTNVLSNGRIDRLAAGNHSVSVKRDNYRSTPFTHVVPVKSGRVDSVFFRLIPLNAVDAVEPHSRPAGSTIPERVTPETDTVLARLLAERQQLNQATEQTANASPAQTTALPDVQLPATTETSAPAASSDELSESVDKFPAPGLDSLRQAPPPEEKNSGTIDVSATLPGATIFVDDQALTTVTPANITLPFGTYEIRTELDGFRSEPGNQTVRISRGNSQQTVYFTLTKLEAREIFIQTEPVEGDIFLDSVFVGKGTATVPHNFGIYLISYGEIDGWRTPAPLRLTVSPSKPRPEVKGVYTKRSFFYIAAGAGGTLDKSGEFTVSTGVHFEESGFETSGSGPKIKQIPGSQKFGWELAMGDANKNPTGEDFVQFDFTIADDVDLNGTLNLRLYCYRSPRRYPLSRGAKNELIVTINGKSFLPAWNPRYNSDAADTEKYEEWPLDNRLLHGPNRIVVRTSPENTVYQYLWKMELN